MMDVFAVSEIGSRGNNEDYMLYDSVNGYHCCIVCDGLGGQADGEVASRFVAEFLMTRFRGEPTIDVTQIEEWVTAANTALIEHVGDSGANTTLTMVVTNGRLAICAHVGDSRIYCLNHHQILYQSVDHSVPQMLVQMGEITPDQIRGHEDSNRLLRVMGMEWDKPKVEINTIYIDEKEPFGMILCSDGFWEYVLESKMIRLFSKAKTSKKWLEKMLRVLRRKANLKTIDNYTIITVMMNK